MNAECFYFGSYFMCKASAEDLFSLLFPSLLLQHSWSNVQTVLGPWTLCSLSCSSRWWRMPQHAQGRIGASALSASWERSHSNSDKQQPRANVLRLVLATLVGSTAIWGRVRTYSPSPPRLWSEVGLGTMLCSPLIRWGWWGREGADLLLSPLAAFQASIRAYLKADKFSKSISIGMKTHEVQICFCIGHSCRSSRSQVPFRWMSLFLPAMLIPNTQGITKPTAYAVKPQKFHKAENYCGGTVANASSLPSPQRTQTYLNTVHEISP